MELHALLVPDVVFEIVLHLDFHTILRCQRVCRIWKYVISRSREARQILFLEPSGKPFATFKKTEENDISAASAMAFKPPQQRILLRRELRALFNPWTFMHGSDPISQNLGDAFSRLYWDRKPSPLWRFTDRISSGRLDFCFIPSELVKFVDQADASLNKMFLTQPPVKRVLITVQGGYMPNEEFDVEKDVGVKIGDILSRIRDTRAVKVMRGKNGDTDFTTIDLRFDEHFTGVKFMPLQQCARDQFGNVYTKNT